MRTAANETSARPTRVLTGLTALIFAMLAAAMYRHEPWVVSAWPWPEAPISFVFLASITASVATVWFSVALTGELAALAGVGLNIVVAAGGAVLFLAWQIVASGPAGLWPALGLSVASGLFGLWLWGATRALPVHDPRALPRFVRWAYLAFTVTLIVAGTALVLQRQVFPWALHPSSATLFGCIFLGAAAFFANAVHSGRWAIAAPALWGFLAYDLVLFVPYLQLLSVGGAAADDIYGAGQQVNMASLAIYLSVLTASALLALYAALLHPATRLWRAVSGPAP